MAFRRTSPISEEDAEVLKTIELDEVGLKRDFGCWLGRSMKGSRWSDIFGATCVFGIQTGHTDAGAKTVLPSSAMAPPRFSTRAGSDGKDRQYSSARTFGCAWIQRHRNY